MYFDKCSTIQKTKGVLKVTYNSPFQSFWEDITQKISHFCPGVISIKAVDKANI